MNAQGNMEFAAQESAKFIDMMKANGFIAIIMLEGQQGFVCGGCGTNVQKLGLVELAKMHVVAGVQKDGIADLKKT